MSIVFSSSTLDKFATMALNIFPISVLFISILPCYKDIQLVHKIPHYPSK